MSQFNCSCSCSEKKYIEQEPEEAFVANAMKEFGYNSVPGLHQTTQVEIGCLYDAVADHKENTKDCLVKCEEARLNTCLDEDNAAMAPEYCFVACGGTLNNDYSGVKIDGDVLIDVGDDTSVERDDINIIDDDAEDKKGESNKKGKSDKKASSSSVFGNVNNIIIVFIIVLLVVAAFFGYRIYKNRQTKNSNMFNYTSNYRFREY